MDPIEHAKQIVWKEEQKRYRKEARKERIRKTVHDAVAWTCRNAEMIAAVAPVAVFATRTATGIVKTGVRGAHLRKEQNLKELYCYDRSLGHYWELRRKLSNREWIEIDKRKKAGEKLGDILKELKVLK